MNAAHGFLGYFFDPFTGASMQGLGHALAELFASANPLFWLLVVILARFGLPDVVLWLVNLFYPRAFAQRTGPGVPDGLVSVVIAGRNVGSNIVDTMRTVLDCGYPKIEVIYVDDYSSDDSVAQARTLERTGKVRVFEASRHNGKPTSLNIGLSMARGEFIFILDADSELQPGTAHQADYEHYEVQPGVLQQLLAPFADPEVGAVAANLRVRNATKNVLTRLQECEYAMNVTISRMWRGPLGLLTILPGAGSMFRAEALRALGGYDTGLGDDTDLTMRLRKQGWKLRFALRAVVWTDVPENFSALLRQRSRWARNMVKVRLHKQGDLYRVWRFGMLNALIFLDIMLFRLFFPLFALGCIVYYGLTEPFTSPEVLTGMYWITIFFLLVRMLIANDIAATPRLSMLWWVPLYPFYRLPIRIIELLGIVRELLHLGKWHPYVPKRIWEKIPHW